MNNETIKPSALGKSGAVIDASGVYDWQSQSYKYDVCKFGTFQTTHMGTSSYIGASSVLMSDDNNSDNYSD